MKFFLLTVILFILACTQSDDGPISIYPDEMAGEYSGFVLKAELDSGSSIHLRSESLQVTLDSIWTLSNCFLDKLFLEERIEDTILYLEPKVEFSLTSEDCASPLFFPETLIYMPPSESWAKARSIVVLDSKGEAEDSVALRSGEFIRDSLKIYLDSNFANPYLLPRRTKGTPSVLKTLDSLEERVFYYRLMPSNCGYIIDSCETILDTIYPAQWSLRDTNLVPIRKTCKDSTMRYCLQRDWVDDSLGVGKLKEKYPYLRRVYVRASFQYIDNDYENYLLKSYEETYFPLKIANAGKGAYVERNYEMIDKADVCVFYYDNKNCRQNSGTKIAYEYANRKHKKIINLCENN